MGKKKKYESPYIVRTQVEMESGFCAGSYTDKPVVDENNNRVNISEQGHGSWNGSGFDMNVDWEEQTK